MPAKNNLVKMFNFEISIPEVTITPPDNSLLNMI